MTQLDPKQIKPHQLHAKIYGDGADEAFIESIKQNGIIVPLVATRENGHYRLIAGHRRREAAIAVGLQAVDVRVREFGSEAQEKIAVIESNRQRVKIPIQVLREGTALDELYSEEAKRRERHEDRSVSVGGRGRKTLVPSGTRVSQDNSARTSERVAKATGQPSGKAWTRLKAIYDEMPEVVEAAPDMASLKRAVKQEKKRRRLERERRAVRKIAKLGGAAVDVHHASMSDLLAGFDAKLDAIVTDPPYSREALPLYEDLAKGASTALRADGILAVMCGHSYLPEIITAMTKHITYRWMLAYLLPGGQSAHLWQRKVNTFWKPVLLFGAEPREWIGDVVKSDVNDNDKRFHWWGQSESGMRSLVSHVTLPNDLVCDPFLGAGTTGVACLSLGRRFVGGDIDADALTLARGRMAKVIDNANH